MLHYLQAFTSMIKKHTNAIKPEGNSIDTDINDLQISRQILCVTFDYSVKDKKFHGTSSTKRF